VSSNIARANQIGALGSHIMGISSPYQKCGGEYIRMGEVDRLPEVGRPLLGEFLQRWR